MMYHKQFSRILSKWPNSSLVFLSIANLFLALTFSVNLEAAPNPMLPGMATQYVVTKKPVTWSRVFGAFCIQDIPNDSRKVISTSSFNGIEVETFNVIYKHKKDVNSYPLLRIFKEVPDSSNPLQTCSELKGEVVLEGYIRNLTIKGGRETVPGEPEAFFMLPSGSFEVEIIKGKTQIDLYGGSMKMSKVFEEKSKKGVALIKNIEDIKAAADSQMEGKISIETWGSTLSGVKIIMPGADHVNNVDLSSDGKSVIVNVPLSATNQASLESGVFTAKNVPFVASALSLPNTKFENFNSIASDVTINADQNSVKFFVNKLAYSSAFTHIQAPRSLILSRDARGTIESIFSNLDRKGDVIELISPQLKNLFANAQSCEYGLSDVPLVHAQSCKISALDGQNLERYLSFTTTNPSRLFCEGVLKKASAVELSSDIKGGNEDFKGILKGTDLQLGTLGFQNQLLIFGNPIEAKGFGGISLQIPFNLEASPGSSAWSLKLPDGKLLVEGSISKAKVKGTVNLDLNDISAYSVEIGEKDLVFDGKVSITHEPYVYGSKPAYGDLGLSFESSTPLNINKLGGEGVIDAKTDLLILSELVIALGDKDESLILKGPQKFEAGVVLAFDLKTGVGEVKSGILDVTNVKVVNQLGKPGDLGGIRMWDGEISVGKLQAYFDEGKGTLAIRDIELKAMKLAAIPKADDSGSGNQLVWSGNLKKALGIQSIEGMITNDVKTNALKIERPLLTQARFSLTNIQMGQGNALRLKGGNLDVHLEKWGDDIAKGSLALNNSHISSRTPNDEGQVNVNLDLQFLNVQITGGTPKSIKGSGNLLTTGINLKTDLILKIQESCDDKPDFQGPPVRLSVLGGPSKIDFKIFDGGFEGEGILVGAAADVESTGEYNCYKKNAIDFKVWPEKIAKYHYPCPTWRKPTRMCEGWTRILPEFRITFDRNIVVRKVKILGFYTGMTLSLDKNEIKACGTFGGASVSPYMDVSYYVTPHTSWSELNSIIDSVLKEVSRPFASATAMAIGTLAANLKATCIIK